MSLSVVLRCHHQDHPRDDLRFQDRKQKSREKQQSEDASAAQKEKKTASRRPVLSVHELWSVVTNQQPAFRRQPDDRAGGIGRESLQSAFAVRDVVAE